MTIDLTPSTLDCGHTVTRKPGSVGTGKATDPETGRTMCYPCAEQWERDRFKNADTYGCYLSSDARHLTTWTGGVLANVVSYGAGSVRYTPSGGRYRMQHVRAEAPDGTLWYGSKSDNMDAIKVRRLKAN